MMDSLFKKQLRLVSILNLMTLVVLILKEPLLSRLFKNFVMTDLVKTFLMKKKY